MILVRIFQHVQFRQHYFFLTMEEVHANPYALKYLSHPVPICLKISFFSGKKSVH